MGKIGGLNQKVADNRGHPTRVAGKGVHQLRGRVVGSDAGDPFESAGESLYKDRAIRAAAWLFWTDLGVAILAHIEIIGAEQFQIGKPPDLIGDPTKNTLVFH